MTYNSKEIGYALVVEAKLRMIEESLPRILKCVERLSVDELWFRPNRNTVSIGNLVLHLCGNVTQWIISGLGGAPDIRNRAQEFAETGPIPTGELVARLASTMAEVGRTLDAFDPALLLETRRVQGHDETPLSIIVHVVEHFSYHTGQIVFAVKSRKDVDTAFYAGQDLNQHNAPAAPKPSQSSNHEPGAATIGRTIADECSAS